MGHESVESRCVLCGACLHEGMRLGPMVDRRKGVDGAWYLKECPACHAFAMDPIPTDEELARYYSAYDEGASIDFRRPWSSRLPRLRSAFHWFSGDVDPRDFLVVPQGGKVLDYGCGHAGYLREFHDRGIAITGAEVTGHLVQACRKAGYDVHEVQGFDRIPFEDASFEVVYLMQVFEHLKDPQRFMGELQRVLKRGGRLYLAVPNIASFWRRVFREDWVSGWFAPFHLFHYDRRSLEALGRRHGLTLVKAWSRTPVSWFRLNVKARLQPEARTLDRTGHWLDSPILSLLLMGCLRLMELPIRERDCLVMEFKRVD